MEDKMKKNTKFFLKVTLSHVFTYILCGIIFSTLFSYWGWISENNNWRNINNDIIVRLAPVFQIIRGVLYGIVFLLIKDAILYSKYGVLKLFVIMIIIGIFNTPAPSPGSIEKLIYIIPSNDPLIIQIGGILEIIIQNLLFCIIVCTKWGEIKNKIFKKV
jgi:hypothetical protein